LRGVTITDALEAGAVAPFGDTGARSVLAAQAGMDVLLCSARDVTQGTAAVQAVAAALQGFSSTPGTPDRRYAACSTCGSSSVEPAGQPAAACWSRAPTRNTH
jgi:beta-glucosidase-like glycosyl hydrolase